MLKLIYDRYVAAGGTLDFDEFTHPLTGLVGLALVDGEPVFLKWDESLNALGVKKPTSGDLAAATEPDSVQGPVKLSFLEFMDLFTEAEQMAIAGAAMADVATKLWYDRAVGAQFIDLGDARLSAGLQALVKAKCITAARRERVLLGVPPSN